MQAARSLLHNTVHASVDRDAKEETQADQLVYISTLERHIIERNIASNVNLVERSLENCDIPVFRWCDLAPSRVFVEGLNAHEAGDTPIEQYCDYKLHMTRGPPPLSTGPPSFSRAFVSTSGSFNWTPMPRPSQQLRNIYRYKIFAPGGIIAQETLRDYRYRSIDEITFVGSIRPCYIHSAEHFELQRRSSPRYNRDYVERVVVNEVYYVNSHFSPGPDVLRGAIDPVHNYIPSGLMHTVVYPPSVPMIYCDYYTDYFLPNR